MEFLRRQSAVASRKKIPAKLETLLEEQRIMPSVDRNLSVKSTPNELNTAQMKYMLINKKTKDMLLKTFVDRIVDMMVGHWGGGGYHTRGRYFTVSDEKQK